MPDENQVSRTSSSETQEQKLSNLHEYGVELIKLGECVCWRIMKLLDNFTIIVLQKSAKLKTAKSHPVWG